MEAIARLLALDSPSAFILHVPSFIYVWIGINFSSVMCCNARVVPVVRMRKQLL
jgi:hypothetical protein